MRSLLALSVAAVLEEEDEELELVVVGGKRGGAGYTWWAERTLAVASTAMEKSAALSCGWQSNMLDCVTSMSRGWVPRKEEKS